MINIFYKLVADDGIILAIGYASARDEEELFWSIDEFTDPTMVLIRKASKFGFCANTKINRDLGGLEVRKKSSECSYEMIEALNDLNEWIKPDIVGSRIVVPWLSKMRLK